MSKISEQIHVNQTPLKSVEDLLLDVVMRFSNMTLENFDHKIQSIFELVGKYFDISWVCLYQYHSDTQTIDNTNEWLNINVTSKIANIQNTRVTALSDNFSDKHTKGEAVILDDVKKMGKDNALSHALISQGISSLASESIIRDGKLYGYVSFEQNKTHVWNDSEKLVLKIIAQLISTGQIQLESQFSTNELERKITLNNKLQGEFLYKMSHDIRTPLGGIYNAIYLLNSTNLSIEQKDFLEIGQASADVMSSIIDGVLDISKIETGSMELFHDLFNLEEELIRVYRVEKGFAAEKGLDFIFDYDYGIKHDLIGDYHKLRQIMLNILSNAIKYTEHGFINISTKHIQLDGKIMVEISVSDSGVGIKNDELLTLKEVFITSDHSDFDKFRNIGFGLSVSYELIKLMGGHLEIESEPEKGSTFKIVLPFDIGSSIEYPFSKQYKALLVSDELPYNSIKLLDSMGIKGYSLQTIKDQKCNLIFLDKEINDENSIAKLKEKYGSNHAYIISIYPYDQKKLNSINLFMEYPVSRRTLHQRLTSITNIYVEEMSDDFSNQAVLNGNALIVDDNRLNRIALESILTKEGMTSKSVSSGLKAIEAVKNESFDIVLMDVQMPDMDGMETTRRIRSLGKNYESLPIIAVTANSFLSDYDFMKSSLMNDIILKPIRVKNLNRILRKYIKATATIQIPNELFVFDQKDFEIRFEGSLDIADEVIESFLIEYHKDLEKIKISVSESDSKKIIEATHYFKGSCSYLSGKRTVWLLSYMINAAKKHSLDMMQMCYELLEKEIVLLLIEIDKYRKLNNLVN